MMSIASNLVVAGLIVVSIVAMLSLDRRHPAQNDKGSIAIVVLGDLARSPRMLYHTQSCIAQGRPVWLIGYLDTPLPSSLTSSHFLRVKRLAPPPDVLARLPRALYIPVAAFKLVWMTAALALALLSLARPAYILVQNPPALPMLPVVRFFASVRRVRLIIDWHNTGASVLALRFQPRHPVVRLAAWLEGTFGRRAYAHLFVTKAMQDALSSQWCLLGDKRVLYDRPPASFHRLSANDAQTLFEHLRVFDDLTWSDSSSSILVPDRPALLVSSTSWTADEDFSVLLDALSLYERAAKLSDSRLPRLLAIVTGKGGSLRETFERDVVGRGRAEGWRLTRARTAWLERADYPPLLGAADLGVSLHASTSGFDLPMKVVDMFGCGLPVLALDFPALSELVQDGVNGRVFKTAEQLADHLCHLLRGFPGESSKLDRLRDGITKPRSNGMGWTSWEESWTATVAPLLID